MNIQSPAHLSNGPNHHNTRPSIRASLQTNPMHGDLLNLKTTVMEKIATVQISRQQYLTDNHFAKVNIILGDHRHTFITDHPQISLSSLLAKLGGSLNLWSGITVVIVIEFIDFILRLILTKSENSVNNKK